MKKIIGSQSLLRSIAMTLVFLILAECTLYLPLSSPVLEFVQLFIYLLAVWIFIKKIDRVSWRVLKLRLDKKAVIAFCLSFVPVAVCISLGSAISRWLLHDETFSLRGEVNIWTILAMLLLFFIESFVKQGIPEEIVFRGYIVQTLSKRYSFLGNMVISVGLFTTIHAIHIFKDGFYVGLLTMFYAFSFACLSYLMKMFFETTWAAIAVHGGVHMTNFMLLLVGFKETMQANVIQSFILLAGAIFVFYTNKNKFLN